MNGLETRPPNSADEFGRLKAQPLNRRLIFLLTLAAEADDDTIIAAVEKLKESRKQTAVLTEFDKKVQARISRALGGSLPRREAELAQRSQDAEDQRRLAMPKKK